MEAFWANLVVAIGWFLGGIVGAATGIGGVMAAMPLLTLVLNPAKAVLVSCIVGVFGSAQLTVAYRKYCTQKDILELLLGAVPGCFLGTWVLRIASMHFLQVMVCLMILLFIFIRLVPKIANYQLPEHAIFGFLAGIATGFVNASVAMMGVPLGIYVLLKHWSPDRARGNMSVIYLFSGIVTVSFQFAAGLHSVDLLVTSLSGMAGAYAGQVLGIKIGRHINQNVFQRIVVIFLSVAALILFVQAFRQ